MLKTQASALKIEGQLAVDTLQCFLLIGRLPTELAANFIGVTGEPRDLSAAACLMFAGSGIHWPIPCLARQWDGGWWDVESAGPGDGSVWQQ